MQHVLTGQLVVGIVLVWAQQLVDGVRSDVSKCARYKNPHGFLLLMDSMSTASTRCMSAPQSWPSGSRMPWSSSPSTALSLSLIHISEPTRLGISYAVFCLKKKKKHKKQRISYITQNQKQKQIKKQKKHKN